MPTALAAERAAAVERLRALTPEERRVVKGSGRTTRRAFRRMLEHE